VDEGEGEEAAARSDFIPLLALTMSGEGPPLLTVALHPQQK
jgi:hypothetical protein